MKKIYCYVDESGQHSKGDYFIVSVVIIENKRDELIAILEKIERETRKNKYKWTKAKDVFRTAYVKAVLRHPAFKGCLFSITYKGTKDYVGLTVSATAWAIHSYILEDDYKATVIVDGLQKSERHRFGVGLRKAGITTQKIVGGDDRKEAFIRLADALCGFIADAQQGRKEYTRLLRRAEREGVIQVK